MMFDGDLNRIASKPIICGLPYRVYNIIFHKHAEHNERLKLDH